MASGDRFYLMEFDHRPVMWGDVGSNLRINGLVVGGPGLTAVLFLPGLMADMATRPIEAIQFIEPSVKGWSDFIQASDDPEIYVLEGNAKIFHRKIRYAISGAVQQKIWAADSFQCVFCGAKMGDTLLTVDHFVPLEMGGKNDHTNYVSACRACNKKKGSRPPIDFLATVHRWLGSPQEKFDSIQKYLKERKV